MFDEMKNGEDIFGIEICYILEGVITCKGIVFVL